MGCGVWGWGGGDTGAPTAMNQLWGGPACKRLRTPALTEIKSVWLVISEADDAVCEVV